MKKIFTIAAMIICSLSFGQIIVNKEDIKEKVTTFEVWAFKKPFTSKECYFLNYGQKEFRPVNYDFKEQGIKNDQGVKFEKGEWLGLVNYLETQGFVKESERPENIGDVNGRVITFKRK